MEGIASLRSGNPMANNSFLISIFEMGIADYYSKIPNIRFLMGGATQELTCVKKNGWI